MKVNAYAKLNLSLNVGKRCGDFHPVDSVALLVDLCDTVSVSLRSDSIVTVVGCKDIPVQQNTAYKAAVAFIKQFGVCGCDVNIAKHIPTGAGMGGSSADAAAVLRCLCNLHNVDVNHPIVRRICADVGSDVTLLLYATAARMTGKGDTLQPFTLPRPMHFAVTAFDTQLAAKDVYAAFDSIGSGGVNCNNTQLVELLSRGDTQAAQQRFGNGLQAAAMSLSDYAQPYLHFCQAHNLPCTMTGSGSAFFVPATSRVAAQQIATLLNQNGFASTVCSTIRQ